MNALKLYKFIEENELEIAWRGKELVLWVNFYALEDFAKLIGSGYLCECGTDVNLQESCIALDIVDLCEYFGIEPTDILEKEDD